MNSTLERLMAKATQMTQDGSLQSATATIQAALARAGLTGPAGSVAGGPFHPAPASRGTHDTSVIDVDAREVQADPPARPQAAPPFFTPSANPGTGSRARARSKPAGAGRTPGTPGGTPDGMLAGSHTDVGLTRDYKLYIPPQAGERALPLVVMLHGCTQDPDDFAAGTRMNAAAREQGFFVLYPAQAQSANPSRCWNWFKHNHQGRDRGEPALLASLTRQLVAQYGIDPKRVYVAGLSAGGAMAAILGDAYPDVYAAVGVHSGLATGAATDMAGAFAAMSGGGGTPPARTGKAPPTIVFHGDQDSTVSPVNGEQLVADHARRASPQRERARSPNGREYSRSIYRDASGRIQAEHWTVHGAGHAWSGGSAKGSYTDASGPDATREMLRFFFEASS